MFRGPRGRWLGIAYLTPAVLFVLVFTVYLIFAMTLYLRPPKAA